jgi:hypothetical protein
MIEVRKLHLYRGATAVILATQEAEIRRMPIGGLQVQTVPEIPSQPMVGVTECAYYSSYLE